ncbi:uncharacterized protein A4U43_C08F8390 [Asparagus officinalis]|uniref:uncharacterized protein LOC109851558 isoform X2 n=1 Tax=Asparagus officinalis TaxID=4686 RepID=UPI00098E43F0|nr:uncharacterized protein LOC109851558 isoform X2 [Asparagus officinalis]ONK59625.1 uncharacterized protein A4U43_C08F8390 [Asparagus officinalis]
MADRSNADDLRRRLSVDAPPPPVPKDMQGSDNPFPLSPQWLLPKPVDNKLGILSGEPHPSSHHGNRPDAMRASGIGEDSHDAGKRKDVFRPSLHDLEPGRRDRWRDEERETQSAIRRDRWREADKEFGDTRRTERWSENSGRHLGEARRAPSERWPDSVKRDDNYDQRRENKWNSRWGPDDKESDNRREKWSDTSKGYDGSREKGTSHPSIHGRDITSQAKDADGEGEHSRSWRSNSFLARGRGESNLSQSLTPSKQAPSFGYGRGKGENGGSPFSAGRGRVDTSLSMVNNGTSRSYTLGFTPERSDSAHGDPCNLRYSRMKLLDIYRMTDLKSFRISLEEFLDVPSLTIAEPLEPLALSAPTSEELVTLKAIDKGDIVSSGLPQVSKDGSVGKNSVDPAMSKPPRLGSREDTTFGSGDYKDESGNNIQGDYSNYLESATHRYQQGSGSKAASSHLYQENKLSSEDEMGNKEVSMLERSSSHHSPWRSQSARERSRGSSTDWQDLSSEARTRSSDVSRHLQKNLESEQTYFRDKLQWQDNDLHSEQKNDFKFKRQSSEILDLEQQGPLLYSQENCSISREKCAGKFPPALVPEDLSLHYKDPQGQIQGPFSGSDLIGWFEAGYFGIDLQVRIAGAPPDAPFSLLGDVMPHLRAKAGPPPGFGGAKQNDAMEVSSRGTFGSLGNAHAATNEFDVTKSMQINRHGGATEAENRFIESLMSGNMSNSSSEHYPFPEGIKGYNAPSARAESMSDMNYLLAQRMSLERQKSIPTALPYWSGRDASLIGAKPDMVPELPSPQSKFLPHVGEASGQIPQSPQQVDFLSLLQAASGKPSSSAVTSAPVWPNATEVSSLNNLVHGGMDMIKDKMDMHLNQHITSQGGFGAQHQRVHPQTQPSFSHLLGQPVDLSPGVAPPEKLLASEISQDPQLLGLLQQQYLMSQIQHQSQSSIPPNLSLLDKYLLLKQQQQQRQEQQLLLQQQHLLSQVLSGPQPHQHFGDPSMGHLKASPLVANVSADHLGLHQMHETLMNNQQMPVLNSLDGRSSDLSNVNIQGSKDVSLTVSSGLPPPNLPHQMFNHSSRPDGWDNILPKEVEGVSYSDPVSASAAVNSFVLAEPVEKSAKDGFAEQGNVLDLDNSEVKDRPPAVSNVKENMTSAAAGTVSSNVVSEGAISSDIVSSLSEKINDANLSPERIPTKSQNEVLPVKEVKKVEVKEAKKASEKKSRKQKSSKSQLVAEHGKGSSTVSSKQAKPDVETEGANIDGRMVELQMEVEESLHMTQTLGTELTGSVVHAAQSEKAEQGGIGTPSINSQTSTNRAWKPAPGLKPKSLLEIQQEEQRRLQTAPIILETSAAPMPTNNSRTPWAGVVANSEQQSRTDTVHNLNSSEGVVGISASTITSKSRKSQLHDLLAEEVLAKSNEEDNAVLDENGLSLPPLAHMVAQAEAHDGDFIEAKDSKKSRKKAAKAAKAAGLKASPPVNSAYLSASVVAAEKSKSTRQMQQEKELLPVPSAGPSLGDFVPWKGDQSSSSPAPAWSTDSTKVQKPTSLRDILREQGKKNPSVQQQIPVPTPPKVQSSRGNRGTGSSWPVPGSSPSKVTSSGQNKAASPGRTSPITSNQSKPKAEDDLFWGPLDQLKQETTQSDFPSLASPGGKGTSSKVASSTRQKSTGAGSSLPAAGQASSKGKKGAASKHSEATDFRDWCESELVKLTGTNDTSFLEYCLKQSASEAEMLLRENLGSMDRNHEFIDKFLNYKEFLSPDVVEMAFSAQSSTLTSKDTTRNLREVDAEGGGSKKKGKKGKKVSPAVLGFNVMSNRIMMGEIQTIED